MNGKCAGLRVIKMTLSENRETELTDIGHFSHTGQIEDWSGEIVVEVTSACHMSEDACRIVAEALALDELPHEVYADEWNYNRVGCLIHLTPKSWVELDSKTHLRYVK